MIIGARSTWRFGRRSRRAARRFAFKAADVGAWRRAPAVVATTRLGHARAAVVTAPTEPTVAAPADTAAAAEIVLERAPPAAGNIDLADGGQSLIAQLRPACLALSTTAFAATAARRDRLILVSSPSAGEGKSLTAVHLALALSRQEGRPVLLVDGDPHSAGSAQALAWPPEPGLSDALAGAVELEEVIGHTGLDNLSFLPPGSPLAALPELLAGRQLAEVMRALLARQPTGLVVIDAPPLLSGIGAAALAAYAGQVLLLVAAGHTSQQALDEGLRRLGERAHLHCVFVRPTSAVG